MIESLVLELCGLPGAGKSTVVRKLRDSKTLGIPIHVISSSPVNSSIISRLFIVARYIFFNLGAFRLVIMYGLTMRGPNFSTIRDCMRTVSLLANVKSVRKGGGRVIVLDQGLIQAYATLSVPSGRNGHEKLESFSNLISRSVSAIVYLKGDPDVIESRRRGRKDGDSRFEMLSAGDSRLQEFDRRIDMLVRFLAGQGVPVLYLDAETSILNNVDTLVRWIECLPDLISESSCENELGSGAKCQSITVHGRTDHRDAEGTGGRCEDG